MKQLKIIAAISTVFVAVLAIYTYSEPVYKEYSSLLDGDRVYADVPQGTADSFGTASSFDTTGSGGNDSSDSGSGGTGTGDGV